MTTEYYTLTIKRSHNPKKIHRKPVSKPFKIAILFWSVLILYLVSYMALSYTRQQDSTLPANKSNAAIVDINDGSLVKLLLEAQEQISIPVKYTNDEPTTDPYFYDASTAPEEDIIRMTKCLYGEARGCSKNEQAAVIWCILNRVDDPTFPDTIPKVCVYNQFNGYDPTNPVDPELYDLTLDVYTRWQREKNGDPNPGRTLPPEYLFFHGDGKHNYFRADYENTGVYWDWSLPDPYTEGA